MTYLSSKRKLSAGMWLYFPFMISLAPSTVSASESLEIVPVLNLPAPAITTFRPPFTSNLATDGTYIYGTTTGDNINTFGTLYRVRPSGLEYRVLHAFTPSTGSLPTGDLAVVGDQIYGTTAGGGSGPSDGTIYKIATNGLGYQTVYDFASPFGSSPVSGLMYYDGSVYGTTSNGPSESANSGNGFGSIYRIKLNAPGGPMYSMLHSFSGSDGSTPIGGLTVSNGLIFGTTAGGGDGASNGTVFRISPEGTGFDVLYNFGSMHGYSGDTPHGKLLATSERIFGTTRNGGSTGSGVPGSGNGAIFSLNQDGSDFRLLHSFTESAYSSLSGLTQFNGAMFGLTSAGGENGVGAIFSIEEDGSGFSVEASFNGVNGSAPIGSLLALDGALFGNAYYGGSQQSGTVFGASPSAPVPEGSAPLKFLLGLLVLSVIRLCRRSL